VNRYYIILETELIGLVWLEEIIVVNEWAGWSVALLCCGWLCCEVSMLDRSCHRRHYPRRCIVVWPVRSSL